MAGVAPVNPKFTFTEAPAGSLDVYLAGTTTRTTTWQDSTQLTENENPISLNARGECSIYLDPDLTYKFVLKNAGGVTIWTQDNIKGADSGLRGDLSADDGADLVRFIQAGTSAAARTLQDKARDIVSVKDLLGVDSTGATDSSAALAAGISALLAALACGVLNVYVPADAKLLIDSNVTLPDGATLVGPWTQPGELLPATTGDYDSLGGQIKINSAATMTLSDAAGVKGLVVMRKGLDLPFADAAAATAGVAAFAGTAFTVGGADTYFGHLLILGFARAIASSGYERVRCEYVSGDCISGINIENCADISYLQNCHFWPFTTVHQTWTTNALMRRSGNAYKFANLGDWNKVTDSFSYGYFRGFWSSNCNAITFAGCGADNTSTAGVGDHAGAIGFVADGTSQDTRYMYCQSAAQGAGYYQDISAGNHVRYIGSDAWACSSTGINVVGGDATVLGGTLRDSPAGVSVTNAISTVNIDHVRFKGIGASGPVSVTVGNDKVHIGPNNDFGDWADGTPVTDNTHKVLRQVASAATVNLPATGKVFYITGSTNISAINGGWAEREVTLIFAGALTVTDGASMALNGNLVTAAGTVLELVHTGSAWLEASRSVN